MEKVDIYTDGACEPNPGPGGWAYVIVHNGHPKEVRWGFDPKTTNNIMELKAILNALLICSPSEAITIYSDSQYCVYGINSWMHTWKKKGWVRKKNKEVKNLNLWKAIYKAKLNRPHAKLEWIRGHSGIKGNDLADQFAVHAITHRNAGKKAFTSEVQRKVEQVQKLALLGLVS